jgi:DegV family protein with EDD domain
LFASEIKELGVYVGHLSFTIEENNVLNEYLDDFKDESEYKQYYDRLRKGGVAKTTILNLQAHIDLFTEMAEKGIKNALHISQSKGLSPTIDNANKAIEIVKETYPDINYIAIESSTTTVAEGILVRTAVEMRDEGKDLDEVVKTINEMKGKLQHFLMVDDLMYLKRGGRVGGAAAMIGTMLRLKPIIQITKEGKLEIINKEMGIKKAFRSMITEIKSSFTFPSKYCKVVIVHTDNEEGAKELQALVKENFGIEAEVRIMGPIIGAHVGPNAIALTFTSNEPRKY